MAHIDRRPLLCFLLLAASALLAAGLASTSLGQQPNRLPPVTAFEGDHPVQALQHEGDIDASPIFAPPPTSAARSAMAGKPAAGRRAGPFQGGWATATWLTGSELDVTDLETYSSVAFPFFTEESPLIFTPGFGVHYFDGLAVVDLPNEVYDAYLQVRWLRKLAPRVMMDLSITPGVYGDFESSADDALRISGKGLALIDWSPTTKFALGAVYLDRADVGLLPAAGMIWTPHEDLRLEVVFPRPKIAWRESRLCSPTSEAEYWWYLMGEFGGDTWAVERAGGVDDQFTYRDFRLVWGLERKAVPAYSGRVEVAYVFGRQIEFEQSGVEIELDDAVMLRAGLGF